jgi:ABC-type uncharacterized transport system substrate-binding protein
MRRRAVLLLLGGAILYPLASVAQQKAIPIIGYLGLVAPGPGNPNFEAFHQGLRAAGFVQGQNVMIEYRYIEGRYDHVPGLAADLVGRKVDVIFTSLGPVGTRELKRATATIPIVFFMGDDPVERGLVASLAQPGGNLTGVTLLDVELTPKRFDLMTEVVPRARALGLLVNPKNPNVARVIRDTQKAARTKNVHLHVLNATADGEIEAAFAALSRLRAGGLIVAGDPFFAFRGNQLVTLAARHAMPAMYASREYPAAGGLISYGASFSTGFRQAGVYVGKILNGARPADLPVVQPTEFELVINSRTANTLGLTIPQSLILRADQIIG